jgi:shikimate dehydrogenase
VTETKASIVVGLVGRQLDFSRAPEVHMREGDQNGLRYIYRLVDLAALHLELDAIPGLLTAAAHLGFNGLAVTHPYKEQVIPSLAELSDDAQQLSAVNTIIFRGGKSIGYNTDCVGFTNALRRDFDRENKSRVVQLGAGGAGKAVAHALLSSGTEHVAIWVRHPEKGRSTVERLAAYHGNARVSLITDLKAEVARANGLVNTTPVGMDAYPGSPLPTEWLRPDLWVSDLIYSPSETELLRAAHKIGAKTANGTGMFVFQAAQQFQLFTGVTPDAERMEAHILALSR